MIDAFTFSLLGYKARLLHPEYGLAVLGVGALAVLLFMVSLRDVQKIRAAIPARLMPKMLPGYSPLRRGLRLSAGLFGTLLVSLSLLQPQCGSGTELARKVGIDVVVALDVSRSMLARDVKPSRLERARLELTDLIDHLDGDRFGLVVFAGTAFVQCPMTTDYAAAKLFLRAVDAGQMPSQGTNLGAALGAAEQLLSSREGARGRVVVLLTDGEDHSGNAREVAQRLAGKGARIFAVGIGSPEGEPIPVVSRHGDIIGYKKDAAGNTVLSRLDAKTLQELADVGKGSYVAAGTAGAGIDQVITKMDEMEKTEFEARLTTRYEDRSVLFLAPGFFFLLLAAIIRPGNRPRRTGGKRAVSPDGAASLLPLLLLLSVPWIGGWRALQSEDPAVVAGNEAFDKGDYESAVKAYDDALGHTMEPADRARVNYNKGTALAASGKMDDARGALQAALADSDEGLKATDLYNLGTGLLKANELEGAKKALIRSLQIDPENSAARHNLELALRGLKPPEKDPQKKDQEQKEDDAQKKGDDQQEKDQAEQKKDQEGKGEQQKDDTEAGKQKDEGQRSDSQKQGNQPDPGSKGEEKKQQKKDGEGKPDPGSQGEDQQKKKPDSGQGEGQREKDKQQQAEQEKQGQGKRQEGDQKSDDPKEVAAADARPGAAGEKKEGAAAKMASEEAERILDALSRSEKPMQMQLFRVGEYQDEKPVSGGKDW